MSAFDERVQAAIAAAQHVAAKPAAERGSGDYEAIQTAAVGDPDVYDQVMRRLIAARSWIGDEYFFDAADAVQRAATGAELITVHGPDETLSFKRRTP